ncbi:MAG TPA: peptidoglycan bridge formation glycyltransferase FemA/FemB family protein [Candidatus Saccharimonadia bacterium]
MELVEITDQAAWDAYVSESPWGHPLQLWGWGETKRENHWRPVRLAGVRNGQWQAVAQVLLWPIPRTQWLVAYVPRGPVAEPEAAVAQEFMELVAAWAKEHRVIYVRIEPGWRLPALGWPRWRRAKHQIQMAQTYVLDLRKSEDELLQAIDRKKRYLMRRAEKDGVSVRRLPLGELGDMMPIYRETAARAGFGLHSEHYYQRLVRVMGEHSYLMAAEYEGKMVAFLWLLGGGAMAIELYAGANEVGRNLNVNYLLKWQAITLMKSAGYMAYDLNGRVSEGVSGFKAHFSPEAVDFVGAWDRPLAPALYAAWEGLWPLIKRAGRLVRGRK